jgi:hypothetical protein
METKKTWLRPTQITKTFPANKYDFSAVFKRVGDTVETHPMSEGDAERFRKALNFWAYYHRKTGVSVVATLTKQHRERDFA